MANWQRRARVFIAVSAAIFAIFVAFMFSRRVPGASGGVIRLSEKAVMESRGGEYVRRTGEREDLKVQFEKQPTYTATDGTVRAPGPVEFSKGRMSGGGMGMTYDKERDVMTILAAAVVH